jgi:hypothetical protein
LNVKHIKAINRKADRIERSIDAGGTAAGATDGVRIGADDGFVREDELEVVGLESQEPGRQGPHFPLGCSLVFFPGWEADRSGGTAGLCQPVERDLFDCHLGCFWPAHVPDQLNHAADWTSKCASAQKDWRKLDLIFP